MDLLNLGHSFSGSYNEYFGLATDTDSFNYLQLANHVSQKLYPETITIAEVSNTVGIDADFHDISSNIIRKFLECRLYVVQ